MEDDENATIFTPVHKSLIKENLLLGCEIKLVVLLACVAMVLILTVQGFLAIGLAILMMGAGIPMLQRVAKADPKMSEVLMRYFRRRRHYDAIPARSGFHMTPYTQYED